MNVDIHHYQRVHYIFNKPFLLHMKIKQNLRWILFILYNPAKILVIKFFFIITYYKLLDHIKFSFHPSILSLYAVISQVLNS